jgi:hypothetical protein
VRERERGREINIFSLALLAPINFAKLKLKMISFKGITDLSLDQCLTVLFSERKISAWRSVFANILAETNPKMSAFAVLRNIDIGTKLCRLSFKILVVHTSTKGKFRVCFRVIIRLRIQGQKIGYD